MILYFCIFENVIIQKMRIYMGFVLRNESMDFMTCRIFFHTYILYDIFTEKTISNRKNFKFVDILFSYHLMYNRYNGKNAEKGRNTTRKSINGKLVTYCSTKKTIIN